MSTHREEMRARRLERFTMRAFLTIVVLSQTIAPSVTAQTRHAAAPVLETYASVATDANGYLVIVNSNGERAIIRKEGGQTAFSDPILSPARTAVGAQAMFPNCCTSYDIPLQLVVYAGGKVHRFTGIGLPIFQWGFSDGGTRVAYGQEPVHFGCATHYELRDVESERLLDKADVPQPCGQNPNPEPFTVPSWVADLISQK